MKTTVEIPDRLLAEAREISAREGTTLRALVEQGLGRVVEARKRGGAFRLRNGSFKGQGLQPAFADAGWEEILDASYEGRGAFRSPRPRGDRSPSGR